MPVAQQQKYQTYRVISQIQLGTCTIPTAAYFCEDVIVSNNVPKAPVTSYRTKPCTVIHKLLGSECTTSPIKQQLQVHFTTSSEPTNDTQRTIANYEHLLAVVNEHATARHSVLKKTVKDF